MSAERKKEVKTPRKRGKTGESSQGQFVATPGKCQLTDKGDDAGGIETLRKQHSGRIQGGGTRKEK